jgi:hypothetical protein
MALIHAAGLFIEPGASKNIGESAAPTSPGKSRTPHMAVATIGSVERGAGDASTTLV